MVRYLALALGALLLVPQVVLAQSDELDYDIAEFYISDVGNQWHYTYELEDYYSDTITEGSSTVEQVECTLKALEECYGFSADELDDVYHYVLEDNTIYYYHEEYDYYQTTLNLDGFEETRVLPSSWDSLGLGDVVSQVECDMRDVVAFPWDGQSYPQLKQECVFSFEDSAPGWKWTPTTPNTSAW